MLCFLPSNDNIIMNANVRYTFIDCYKESNNMLVYVEQDCTFSGVYSCKELRLSEVHGKRDYARLQKLRCTGR